jgi:hypothetical protein
LCKKYASGRMNGWWPMMGASASAATTLSSHTGGSFLATAEFREVLKCLRLAAIDCPQAHLQSTGCSSSKAFQVCLSMVESHWSTPTFQDFLKQLLCKCSKSKHEKSSLPQTISQVAFDTSSPRDFQFEHFTRLAMQTSAPTRPEEVAVLLVDGLIKEERRVLERAVVRVQEQHLVGGGGGQSVRE